MGGPENQPLPPQEEIATNDPEPPKTEEVSMPAQPVSDGLAVFPIPCRRFVASLVHTEYEVYSK